MTLTAKLAGISSSQLLLQSGIKLQQQHPTVLTAPAPGKASCRASTTLRNPCWHQMPSWPPFPARISGATSHPQAISPKRPQPSQSTAFPRHRSGPCLTQRGGANKSEIAPDFTSHSLDKASSSFSALGAKVYKLHFPKHEIFLLLRALCIFLFQEQNETAYKYQIHQCAKRKHRLTPTLFPALQGSVSASLMASAPLENVCSAVLSSRSIIYTRQPKHTILSLEASQLGGVSVFSF